MQASKALPPIKIFNYRFEIVEISLVFFCYLLTENIFSWLLLPNSLLTEYYTKLVTIGTYLFLLYKLPALKTGEKIFVGIFTLLLIRLVIESLYEFGTPFQEFTMYTVLCPVIFALFIKYICRVYDLDLLGFISKFYIATYIIFMVIYGRGFSFSLDQVIMDDYGPFSGDSRIIHAHSILMMIIPFLYYLNEFFKEKKFSLLVPVVFCLIVIVIHQHRSVWSCCIMALAFYIITEIRANRKAIPYMLQLVAITAIVVVIAYIFITALEPGFVNFLGDRFSEIFDPAKEGSTGNFRIEQREVYFKLFLQRPVFGWTFDGFEMPNPLVDWWPAGTGQHFHEGYMEMLFYQGVVGLVFKYCILFYFLVKIWSRKLSSQTRVLMSFCISGLLFSFNYVPTLIFWGHVGLCLYYLEKDIEASKMEPHSNDEEQEARMMQSTDLAFNKNIQYI